MEHSKVTNAALTSNKEPSQNYVTVILLKKKKQNTHAEISQLKYSYC